MVRVTHMPDDGAWAVRSRDGGSLILCPDILVASSVAALMRDTRLPTSTAPAKNPVHNVIWYDPGDVSSIPLHEIPDAVTEIWIPSESAKTTDPFQRPIHIVPPPVVVPDGAAFQRSYFDLLGQRTVFLAILDDTSEQEHLKISASVAAFRDAFGKRADVEFVILLRNVSTMRGRLARISELNQSDHRIWFWDTPLSPEEQAGLIRTADAFVSLHLEDRFGLDIARAMRLGTAIIATATGGSAQFTTDQNSIRIPLADDSLNGMPDHVAAVSAFLEIADDAEVKNRLCTVAQTIDFNSTHKEISGLRLATLRRELHLQQKGT